MAVVKPSLVKAKVQDDSPSAWDVHCGLRAKNSRVWEAATSVVPALFESAERLADNKPVQHRMVIDYKVVNSHTEANPYPLPLLHEQGLFLAGLPRYTSPGYL